MTKSAQLDGLDDIAVIGMAARVPGAQCVDLFWQNLRNGVESISFFSDEELVREGVDPSLLNNPSYVKAGAVLDDIEFFDASFFGYSPREAELIDPQQRLFLECAWEALESAGYDPVRYKGQIGIYAGSAENAYWTNILHSKSISADPASSLAILTANGKDYLATRVSYKLNFRGPSMVVQTACSTSLVATHLACQALLNGECDIALAGGVAISVPHKIGYLYQEGMNCSPDGHCRAFDAGANGTVFGSGLGIVVLKRLADALKENDTVRAIIKSSAVNNDGALKIGYTAPSEIGQAHVIAEALAIAGVEPATVSYVETQGVGTLIGDAIEVAALTKAFRLIPEAKGVCAIGSVKSNLGHLMAAAGVISLIKTVLALEHKQIPPTLHYREHNPQIDFANGPFYVNTELSDWKTSNYPRRAGVSSFGIGGTNAHVLLEEAAVEDPSSLSRPWHLLLLSARTDTALEKMTANLANHLRNNPGLNLADVAYTLQVGRKIHSHRRMAVCRDVGDAARVMETVDSKRVYTNKQERCDTPVAFMFTGPGSQYVGMAKELYATELTFRAQVDHCCELLKPRLGLDLRGLIYPKGSSVEMREPRGNGSLDQIWFTQSALFVIEYALATLWMEWGIKPKAMIGYSIGEYVAACLAGVISLEDALALVAAYGRLMQESPSGAMLSVALDEEKVSSLLGRRLSLAAVNSPSMCVVSGPANDVDVLAQRLRDQGTPCQRLHTSHALHSAMMEPILEAFTRKVEKIKLNDPTLGYISNVTGTWVTGGEATDASYWARHLRQTVRFGDGMRELMKDQRLVLLEVGPGQTLTSLVRRNMEKEGKSVVLSSLRQLNGSKSDLAVILETLGRLWLAGAPINWPGFYTSERRRRIPLPTYPFERQRYWGESLQHGQPRAGQIELTSVQPNGAKPRLARPELTVRYVAPGATPTEIQLAEIWEELLGVGPIGIRDNFFDLGGNSLLAVQMVSRVEQDCGEKIPLSTVLAGPTIEQLANALVDKQRAKISESPVVTINKGRKTKYPFFFLHGDWLAGGFYSLKLARLLGQDQPFYVLPPFGTEGGPAAATIENMAAEYIEAMRTIDPEGPYILGGTCNGGILAFEMARQLEKQKKTVALLIAIGSNFSNDPRLRFLYNMIATNGSSSEGDRERTADRFLTTLDIIARFKTIYLYSKDRLKDVRRLSYAGQFCWAFNLVKNKVLQMNGVFSNGLQRQRNGHFEGPQDIPEDGNERLLHYFAYSMRTSVDVARNDLVRNPLLRSVLRSLGSYIPRPYRGAAVLFVPIGEYSSAGPNSINIQRWRRVARRIKFEMVPGQTHIVTVTRHVDILAEKIKNYLEQLG